MDARGRKRRGVQGEGGLAEGRRRRRSGGDGRPREEREAGRVVDHGRCLHVLSLPVAIRSGNFLSVPCANRLQTEIMILQQDNCGNSLWQARICPFAGHPYNLSEGLGDCEISSNFKRVVQLQVSWSRWSWN